MCRIRTKKGEEEMIDIKILSVFDDDAGHVQFINTRNGKTHTLCRASFLKRFDEKILRKFEKKRRA